MVMVITTIAVAMTGKNYLLLARTPIVIAWALNYWAPAYLANDLLDLVPIGLCIVCKKLFSLH